MKGDPSNPRYTRVEDKVGLMIRGHIRPDQIIEIEVVIQAIMQGKIIKVIDSEEISEETIDKTVEKGTEAKEIAMAIEVEIGIGQEREPFTGNYRRNRSSDSDRSRSGSRTSTNRDRIRCYVCREYDHFARDCPNSREERDLEQLQHMLNMEEQDHRSPSIHSSDKDCRSP